MVLNFKLDRGIVRSTPKLPQGNLPPEVLDYMRSVNEWCKDMERTTQTLVAAIKELQETVEEEL